MAVSIDYFERKLDEKRRLTIPSELRQEFSSGIVITKGFGNYLHIYSQEIWDNEVEPALQGSILDEQVADLNEKQGRVTIGQYLLDYAGIERDVIATRAGKYWRLEKA